MVKGNFEQGDKVGVWSFMGEKNSLYLKYDYYQNKLLQNINESSNRDSVQIKIGNEFKLTIVDNLPVYLGYKNEIVRMISKNIKPPKAVFNEVKPGLVIASFEVNEKGETQNFKIENSYNDKINESAKNSIEGIKYGWVPAAINGASVISKMYIIYNFSFISDPNFIPAPSKFNDKDDLIVVNLTYMHVVREKKVIRTTYSSH